MSSSSTDQDITDSTTDFCLPAESYCSLISHQYVNPALPDGHPFTDVFSGLSGLGGRKNMRKYILYGMLVIALCGPNIVQADAPHELAGFVLGGRMNEFKDQVKMDTVIPTRYLESLQEVEATEIKGFKTGLVTYGTCIEPSRIVRLKFKYAENSKRFFDELLERYKVNLGKPDEWRGDPFHIISNIKTRTASIGGR
jgi:hypothetical protein